jgi:hypothetical protein
MSDTQPPAGSRGGKSTFELWLASLPCVSSACQPPANAPLTPKEVDQISEYLRTRCGPASSGR